MDFLDELTASAALRLWRWEDLDKFPHMWPVANVQSLPLRWSGISPAAAMIQLRSCTISVHRTFPRIARVNYDSLGTVVGFSLDRFVGARVNGIDAEPTSLVIASGKARCEIVESQANLIACIELRDARARGWPCDDARTILIRANADDFRALQDLTRKIVLSASQSPLDAGSPKLAQIAERKLLSAVERIFLGNAIAQYQVNTSQLSLIEKLDELLAASETVFVSSAALCRELSVPLATLNAAMRNIRGLSLQQYWRLKRLWSVRRRLLSEAVPMVSNLAVAHGFRDSGGFAKLYRDFFGEAPNQTLNRKSRTRRTPVGLRANHAGRTEAVTPRESEASSVQPQS